MSVFVYRSSKYVYIYEVKESIHLISSNFSKGPHYIISSL